MASFIIDGVTYVPGSKVKPVAEGGYSIIRTYSAGVFAGYIESRDGKEGVITSARRLWYWSGAASLSQLAMEGVNRPEECKFPCEVPEIIVTEIIEILPCTEEARLSIARVPVWKA